MVEKIRAAVKENMTPGNIAVTIAAAGALALISAIALKGRKSDSLSPASAD